MAVTSSRSSRWLQGLHLRPLSLMIFLSVVVAGYVGWRIAAVWPDRPLPASSVAARKLKIDQAGVDLLTQALTIYRRGSDVDNSEPVR